MTILHHIELYVSDLAVSRAFYGGLLPRLGMTLYQEWEQGFSYQDDAGVYLVFVQTDTAYLTPSYHRCRVGLNHLALTVPTRQAVDDLRQWVQQQGGRLLYDDRYPYAGGAGHYALYFEDPDRIKLEIVACSL